MTRRKRKRVPKPTEDDDPIAAFIRASGDVPLPQFPYVPLELEPVELPQFPHVPLVPFRPCSGHLGFFQVRRAG